MAKRIWWGVILGGAVAAVAAYLMNPERRQTLLGLAGGAMDDSAERDQATTAQVETEVYRDGGVAKDQININTVDGVVYVRGTVETKEQIDEIERRIKTVQGVDAVINLLRLPTPAR